MKKKIIDNLKTIFFALIIALFIRSFFFQPFYIPSSSMEPSLLIGDRLFVSKYTYGYSRHSLPFSPKIYSKRIFEKIPKRGDVIVFKTNYKNDDIFLIRILCNLFKSCKTDYIKRLIGLPGDKIQFINGDLFINNTQVFRTKDKNHKIELNCGSKECIAFEEKLPGGVIHNTIYSTNSGSEAWSLDGIGAVTFTVPEDHYFFLGDNRDNSTDSRFFYRGKGPGYVNEVNLVGKAKIIFFSNDKKKGIFFKFWKWHESIRIDRFFNKIQ